MLRNKINGKIYIGQTIRNIEERLKEHETGKSRKCRAIYNAIKKRGWENFEKDYYECPDGDLNKHEELMVEVLGTLAPDGYNLREGGGNRGKHSEETKQKLRVSHLGKTPSEETKKKLSESKKGDNNHMCGKTHTEENKQKMSEAKKGDNNHMYEKRGEKHPMYGKIHTEETKRKISESLSGEKHHNSKRVYQYDLDGNYIASFGSGGEAGRHLGKYGSDIGMCARSKDKNKTAYGFKWSYVKL